MGINDKDMDSRDRSSIGGYDGEDSLVGFSLSNLYKKTMRQISRPVSAVLSVPTAALETITAPLDRPKARFKYKATKALLRSAFGK